MMDFADVKQAAGTAVQSVRKVGAALSQSPALALTAAVAVGFFAGLLLRRREKSAPAKIRSEE
jgi:hypothetical protein